MACAIHPSVLFLMILLPFCVLARTKIDVGSSLTAGDDKASPWLSPNKDFAFGFRNIDGKGDSFVLAIWFYNTPDQLDNIVWYPKDTDPAPKGSKVELTADRGFVLNDPKSGKELWRSGTNLGVAAAGFLNDTGNLVVLGTTSERLWQSFENPADTILPGQVLRKGGTKNGHVPLRGERKDEGGLVIVISARLGSSALFNLVFMFLMCTGAFLWYNRRFSSRTHPCESIMEGNLHCFTYKELAEATNGYNEELGRGSVGIVYKGEIDRAGSKIPIAVKKLDGVVEDSEKEFKAEVNVIGQTHHKNLVRLLGFCNEGQNRLLVYEFLSNGSVASFLFREVRPSWDQRSQIALGIARGLLYLHEECKTQVIHCDIKPQNIMLDEYYNAQIADFGLAKLLMLDQSRTHTAIRGTKGYVAPEWFRNMAITVKVDVYSFGVLLLEIICCRRSVDIENGGEEKAILSDWAYDCYRRGTLDALVEDDAEVLSDMKKLERFVMVAIWCIQEDPSIRPTMKKAMLMLEGIVQVAVPPCPCPYKN